MSLLLDDCELGCAAATATLVKLRREVNADIRNVVSAIIADMHRNVLPTARTARFASGPVVCDFLKRTTLLGSDPASFARLGPAAAEVARAEGIQAHARAVERRLEAIS